MARRKSNSRNEMKISKPNRISRSYTQQIHGTPGFVLTLLCPVREAEWIEGWDPIEVFSNSGLAEADCVFTTRFASDPEPGTPGKPREAIWYVTKHDAGRGEVEMIKVTPGITACKLFIELAPKMNAAGEVGTEVTITYMHTSLGAEGDAFIEAFTEEAYVSDMRAWEQRMNHFLKHSTCLSDARLP